MRRRFLSLACFCLLLLGCGDEEGSEASVFVGALAGGEVMVASVWGPTTVAVYSCGRDGSLSTSTVWLMGAPSDDTAELTGDGFDIVVTREGTAVTGTWSNGVSTEALDLRAANEPSAEGVFNLLEEPCRTAAIVQDVGGSPVVQGAHFCDPGGPFQQVTPLAPPGIAETSLRVTFDDEGTPEERLLPRAPVQ